MDAAYGYDALGRVVSDATVHGARTMQYDLSGNMTRLTWSDGFYVTYDHLVTGEVSTIKENGSVALATFGYDAQGRRSSLTYGNGAVTSYNYDALSRLAASPTISRVQPTTSLWALAITLPARSSPTPAATISTHGAGMAQAAPPPASMD